MRRTFLQECAVCCPPWSEAAQSPSQPSTAGLTVPWIFTRDLPSLRPGNSGNHLHLQHFQLELRPHLNLCKTSKNTSRTLPTEFLRAIPQRSALKEEKHCISEGVRNIFKFLPILFKAVSLLPWQSSAGPSLCTILHPQAPLLSCVISADAAIEALGGIFTIVLSPGASSSHCSHLQIRINSYKIIHHFAHFAPDSRGLDWFGGFLFFFPFFF